MVEPSITRDGKLIVAHIGTKGHIWTDHNGLQQTTYEIFAIHIQVTAA